MEAMRGLILTILTDWISLWEERFEVGKKTLLWRMEKRRLVGLAFDLRSERGLLGTERERNKKMKASFKE